MWNAGGQVASRITTAIIMNEEFLSIFWGIQEIWLWMQIDCLSQTCFTYKFMRPYFTRLSIAWRFLGGRDLWLKKRRSRSPSDFVWSVMNSGNFEKYFINPKAILKLILCYFWEIYSSIKNSCIFSLHFACQKSLRL